MKHSIDCRSSSRLRLPWKLIWKTSLLGAKRVLHAILGPWLGHPAGEVMDRNSKAPGQREQLGATRRSGNASTTCSPWRCRLVSSQWRMRARVYSSRRPSHHRSRALKRAVLLLRCDREPALRREDGALLLLKAVRRASLPRHCRKSGECRIKLSLPSSRSDIHDKSAPT